MMKKLARQKITNLWFADDIDGLSEEKQKLEALIEREVQ